MWSLKVGRISETREHSRSELTDKLNTESPGLQPQINKSVCSFTFYHMTWARARVHAPVHTRAHASQAVNRSIPPVPFDCWSVDDGNDFRSVCLPVHICQFCLIWDCVHLLTSPCVNPTFSLVGCTVVNPLAAFLFTWHNKTVLNRLPCLYNRIVTNLPLSIQFLVDCRSSANRYT